MQWSIRARCVGSASQVVLVDAVMATRSQLLLATIPVPDMFTSPSGLCQTETAIPCHPDSVAAMDIAPEVMSYMSRLGVTPTRFKVVDYNLARVHFFPAVSFALPSAAG